MILKTIFSSFVDFLFPKAPDILKLESLTPSELLSKLTPAKDLGSEILAIFNYADPNVRTLVWELKYKKNLRIAQSLAVILSDVIKTEMVDRALFDNFAHPILIPIPISNERRLERGYNQTEIICEEIKKLDAENFFDYVQNILAKIKHTNSQTLIKNKKERVDNVKNSIKAVSPELVKDRNIILFDDVTTTGATFSDARRTLMESGAKKILCIAIAH